MPVAPALVTKCVEKPEKQGFSQFALTKSRPKVDAGSKRRTRINFSARAVIERLPGSGFLACAKTLGGACGPVQSTCQNRHKPSMLGPITVVQTVSHVYDAFGGNSIFDALAVRTQASLFTFSGHESTIIFDGGKTFVKRHVGIDLKPFSGVTHIGEMKTVCTSIFHSGKPGFKEWREGKCPDRGGASRATASPTQRPARVMLV